MIQTNKLTKYYGKSIGIEKVDLKLKKGKLYGFVGPNGAGKSTTIKTLLGFLFKTSGEAYINNFDIEKDSHKIKEFTGYTPSDVRLYKNLKVNELIKYNNSFYKNNDTSKELNRLIKLFDLDQNKKIKELSSGNKKKVSLILAMVFNPQVLIFDEPTNGLDPIIQERFFRELKNRTKKGVTILLSSHNLYEIEDYADYVIFIQKGKIINHVNLNELEEYKVVTITNGSIKYIPKKQIVMRTNDTTSFRYQGDTSSLLKLLNKIDPDDVVISNKKLDKYFRDIYR